MVGLIIPIALAPLSVNQRLPSGPAVIPERAAGVEERLNSVIEDTPDSRQRSSSFSSRNRARVRSVWRRVGQVWRPPCEKRITAVGENRENMVEVSIEKFAGCRFLR